MQTIDRAARAAASAMLLGLASAASPLLATPARADSPLVVFLLPENVTARWESQDKPFFVAALAKEFPGAQVKVENALNDASKQQAQAEAALASGAKVLVVTAIDQKGAAVIVNDAEKQGVPVIAYDRLIRNAPVAYYVSVDGLKIGQLQGSWLVDNTKDGARIAVVNGSTSDDNAHLFQKGYMGVLQPLFDKGSRKEVSEVWTPGWDPSKAQAEMEQILTKSNNGVDAVMSANDGMAGGIIAALQAQQLAGKVPVTGLDGTLNSLQLILQGKQRQGRRAVGQGQSGRHHARQHAARARRRRGHQGRALQRHAGCRSLQVLEDSGNGTERGRRGRRGGRPRPYPRA
jgi:D-xylose transport system substrate-binding protein